MPTFGTNTEQAARILQSTIAEYIKKTQDNIMAKYIFLAAMRKKGRIRKCSGGDSIKRAIKHKRAPLHYLTDVPSIQFQPLNRLANISLPPRGFWVGDAVTWWQKWMNRGPAAIIDVTSNLMESLMDDIEFKLADQFYVDGNAASTNRAWHGLESFFSISGAGAGTAGNPTSRVGVPNDNYADQSTALGSKGTWNSSDQWPNGRGATGYHWWSPIVGLYDASGYGSTTWTANCFRVMRQLGIWQGLRGYKTDTWVLTPNAYNIFANAVEARETIRVERGLSKNGLLVTLGFGDVINFEGMEVTYERGVPTVDGGSRTVAGYGINWANAELAHWTPELIYSPAADSSIESMSDRHLALTVSNLYFNPQAQVKACYTTSTDSALA